MLEERSRCQVQVSQRLSQPVFVGVTQQRGSEGPGCAPTDLRPSANFLIFYFLRELRTGCREYIVDVSHTLRHHAYTERPGGSLCKEH